MRRGIPEHENGHGGHHDVDRDGDGILTLIRETVDGLGRLVADHIKLARLELVADVKVQGRRAVTIALIVPFVFLGYALGCVGLALALGRWLGEAVGFFIVGGFHFFAGALAVAVALARLRNASLMRETANEVSMSLATLARPAAGDAGDARPETAPREQSGAAPADGATSRVPALGARGA